MQTIIAAEIDRQESRARPSTNHSLPTSWRYSLLRRPTTIAIAVVLLVGGSGVVGARAVASAVSTKGPHCTLATLKGTYLYENGGVEIGGSTPGPLSGAGAETYNGKGGITFIGSGSSNGTAFHFQTGTGTYTVNPDCTGTEVDTNPTAHYDTFIDPTGNQYTWVETDPGIVAQGTEYRVSGGPAGN
jgi:hypothetical protein